MCGGGKAELGLVKIVKICGGGEAKLRLVEIVKISKKQIFSKNDKLLAYTVLFLFPAKTKKIYCDLMVFLFVLAFMLMCVFVYRYS